MADAPTTPTSTVPQTPPAPPAPDPSDEFSNYSQEELKALLRNTRSEAAERRRENKTLKEQLESRQAQDAEAERKRLEEDGQYKALAEKEQKRAAEIEATWRQRVIGERLRTVAQSEGLLDLELIAMVPKENITFDASGNVVGVEEAVKSYKTAKPMLFKQPQRGPAPTGDQAPTPTAAPTTPVEPTGPVNVMKMTAEEYRAHKEKTLREAKVELSRRSVA